MKRLIGLALIFSMTFILFNSINEISVHASIYDGKWGKTQVYDCARLNLGTTGGVVPMAGENYGIWWFLDICDSINNVRFDSSIWGVNGDRYIRIIKEDSTYKLKLYEADGTYVTDISNGGNVYGLDNTQFMYISNNSYGYYFCNQPRNLTTSDSVSYTPYVGVASDSDLNFYNAADTLNVLGSVEITRDGNNLKTTLKNTTGINFTPNSHVTYQWYKNNNEIMGEDNDTYALNDDDKGKNIKVVVSYEGKIKTSNSITIPDDEVPDIVEISRNNNRLIAELKKSDGSEFTTSAAVTYEWYRDNELINGESNSSYELCDDDRGTSIDVKVPEYNLTSAAITITDGSSDNQIPTTPVAVRIDGTQRVGETLEAKLLSEDGTNITTSSGVTYKWYSVSGRFSEEANLIGSSKTYKLTGSDEGKYVKLRISYNGSVFEVISGIIERKLSTNGSSSSSKKTKKIEGITLQNIDLPTISKGWVHYDNNTTKYYEDNKAVVGWKQIDDFWYFFNSEGLMQTGWIKFENQWYYLKNNGVMAIGWVEVGNDWYLFNDNGAMATGWIKLKDKWYYLKNNGVMAIGWLKVNEKWYYFYDGGDMASNSIIKINSDGTMFIVM